MKSVIYSLIVIPAYRVARTTLGMKKAILNNVGFYGKTEFFANNK